MSPLENHHCAVSFKILSSPECNIFTNLSTEEFKEVEIYFTGAGQSFQSSSHPSYLPLQIIQRPLGKKPGTMLMMIMMTRCEGT